MNWEPYLLLARDVALAGAALAAELHRADLESESRADGSIVTAADRAVETLVVERLRDVRPDDAILGEELGASGPRRAALDSRSHRRNHELRRRSDDWSVHVALDVGGDVKLGGVVAAPDRGEIFWSARTLGAFACSFDPAPSAGVRLAVSERRTLEQAAVTAWLPAGDHRLDRLRRLPGWRDPDSLAAMFRVAQGTLDVLVDGTPSQIWDRAPLVVLVEESGGQWSDLDGGRDLSRPGGLFTNGAFHGPPVDHRAATPAPHHRSGTQAAIGRAGQHRLPPTARRPHGPLLRTPSRELAAA